MRTDPGGRAVQAVHRCLPVRQTDLAEDGEEGDHARFNREKRAIVAQEHEGIVDAAQDATRVKQVGIEELAGWGDFGYCLHRLGPFSVEDSGSLGRLASLFQGVA